MPRQQTQRTRLTTARAGQARRTRTPPESASETETPSSPARPRPRRRADAERRPPVTTHCFWPRIRREMTKPASRREAMVVECPICLEHLPIGGLSRDDDDDDPGPSRAVVIACGHVFCRSCLTKTYASQRAQGLAQTCPTCRARMECSRCGLQARMCEIASLPSSSGRPTASSSSAIPLTIPEGGRQAERCMRCAGRDQFIFQVEQGRRGHAGNRIDAGFGRLVWDLMDEAEDAKRGAAGALDVLDRLYALFQERFDGLRREREAYISAHIVSRSGRAPNEWS